MRPPESQNKVDAYFRLAAVEFASGGAEGHRAWRDWFLTAPDFDVGRVRLAIRGREVVGGCVVLPRLLRAGPARLPTGCISAVVTHPKHRGRGIASRLLADVLARAREAGTALLLLDGVADFYHRLGYVDVFDVTWHRVERRVILAQPPSPYTVRPATKADAPDLLALHERHYGGYLGSFDRSLERQRHEIPAEPEQFSPLLAVSPSGECRGYLAFTWEHSGAWAGEVAADDWPAALALLQTHSHALEQQGGPSGEVNWPLPVTSPTFQLLADRLPLRTTVWRQPREDWQARVADGGCLLHGLLPLWRQNWVGVAGGWLGRLEIRLADEAAITLDLGPGTLDVAAAGLRPDDQVVLPPGAFLKVLFGEWDLAWAASQPEAEIPPELLPGLSRLLAAPPAWIPGTDAF